MVHISEITKDFIPLTGILLLFIATIIIVTQLGLPGIQIHPILERINPEPSVEPGESYKVTTEVTVSSNDIENIRYKTMKADTGYLSISSLSLLSVGANDASVDIIYKKNGEVVASDSKFLGDIGATSNKDVTFNAKLNDGTYQRTIIYNFKFCSVLGEFLNDCQKKQVKKTSEFKVPKLPLGEY